MKQISVCVYNLCQRNREEMGIFSGFLRPLRKLMEYGIGQLIFFSPVLVSVKFWFTKRAVFNILVHTYLNTLKVCCIII